MAIKGIEVGAWKLENPEDRIRFETTPQMHRTILGLIALLPEHGVPLRSIVDLPYTDERAGSSVFTLRPNKARSLGSEGVINGVDIRFNQPIIIEGRQQRLETIFDGQLALDKPFELAGGRKLMPWVDLPFGDSIRRVFPQEAPTYNSQRVLLEDVEELSPVTSEGITNKLEKMQEYFVQLTVEPAAFESSAKESKLTF